MLLYAEVEYVNNILKKFIQNEWVDRQMNDVVWDLAGSLASN